MLGVGTTTVVSHVVGRKDHAQAKLLFNQSQVLAMVTGFVFLIVGLAGRTRYSVAMSSLIAIVIGVVWLTTYFFARDSFLRFAVADWRPRLDLWKQMLTIGLPAGFEFAMMAAYMMIVYSITRPFGAAA